MRGGMESYVQWLRQGLADAGDDVRLLVSGAGAHEDAAPDYVAWSSDRLAAKAFLQIANPMALTSGRAAVRGFRPDVALVGVFANYLSPTILWALGDTPTVLSISDYKPVCPVSRKLLPDGTICRRRAGRVCLSEGCVSLPHWLRDRPRYAFLDRAVRRTSGVIACSRWMREVLAGNGIESVDLTLPVPPPSPDFRRMPASQPLFVFVGRLSVEKGGDVLLRAFARVAEEVPGARLRFVGPGPLRDAWRSLAMALGLGEAVAFTGRLEPEGVEEELARAWALVAPSTWAEPLGLVAPEAMVRGVPVIASATGGFSETVRHGAGGLLVPNGDVDGLAEAMLRVARKEAFPDQRVSPDVVREVAERHDLDHHVEMVRRILAGAVRSWLHEGHVAPESP